MELVISNLRTFLSVASEPFLLMIADHLNYTDLMYKRPKYLICGQNEIRTKYIFIVYLVAL